MANFTYKVRTIESGERRIDILNMGEPFATIIPLESFGEDFVNTLAELVVRGMERELSNAIMTLFRPVEEGEEK